MIKLKNIVAMLSLLGAMACTENNIAYDEVVDVPEGVYLSGPSSEFSLPIEAGRLTASSRANMLSIRAWLKKDGHFKISYVGIDGQPVAYGKGSEITLANNYVNTFSLSADAEGFSVPAEGLYQVVVNKQRKELTLIPMQFSMQADGLLQTETRLLRLATWLTTSLRTS